MDVYSIELFKRVVSAGISRQFAALVVSGWINDPKLRLIEGLILQSRSLDWCWLSVSKTGERTSSAIELKPILPPRDADIVFRFNIKRLIEEVDEKITVT